MISESLEQISKLDLNPDVIRDQVFISANKHRSNRKIRIIGKRKSDKKFLLRDTRIQSQESQDRVSTIEKTVNFGINSKLGRISVTFSFTFWLKSNL